MPVESSVFFDCEDEARVFALQREELRPRAVKPANPGRDSPTVRLGRACVAVVVACGVGWHGSQAWSQVPQGVPAAAPVTGGQTPTTGGVPQAAKEPQTSPSASAAQKAAAPEPTVAPLTASLVQYAGQNVEAIRYEGVDFDKSDKLTAELTQKAGEPLEPDKVRQTTRRLFATGRYRNIGVRVERTGAGVTLIFAGTPRYYVGRVQIAGVQQDRLASLLEYGSKLNPGASYSEADAPAGAEAIKQVLIQNGYYQPVVFVKTERDDAGQQVNVIYTVAIGPQARVGDITLCRVMNLGITEHDFRKKGKLKASLPRWRATQPARRSATWRTYFQKKDRLEATVTLRASTYDASTNRLNYTFDVDQGPVVKVEVDGAKFSKSRLHLLVPRVPGRHDRRGPAE